MQYPAQDNVARDSAAISPAAPAAARAATPELSVIVPTFNEALNVGKLVDALDQALRGVAWEVIFVDDNSPDGTTSVVRKLAETDARVRCIRRIGRRGLSGAAIEGILASSATAVAVMDGDLQHDEKILATMLQNIRNGDDLVVGTRYSQGGAMDEGFSRNRQRASHAATSLAKRLLGITVSDPMSGFFMMRRAAFEDVAPHLSTQGFKILLDLLASRPGKLRISEVPFQFRSRHAGESKLDTLVFAEYLSLLLAKMTGDWLSLRFVTFAIIGFSGLFVHLLALRFSLLDLHLSFNWSQVAASFVAMTWNFFLNNLLTYRDRRLKGWGLLFGLISFYAICSFGMFANIGVAQMIYRQEPVWWLAGVAGALMSAVFNYAASSSITWGRK
jgi:dolichol-phosphate mannosyltransferase